ncbi:MAG: type I secretion C-terminal target domain-containing protein, partial [Anderseniella sp.]
TGYRVTGIKLNDSISVGASGGYERIEIQNYDDNDAGDRFAISDFTGRTVNTGEPIGLSYDVEVEDEDGDTSSGTINLTLEPEGLTIDRSTSTDPESLVGGSGNDNLVGGSDDDVLTGGVGDDTMTGNDGSDLYIDGDGLNSFVLTDADNAIDTVLLTADVLDIGDPTDLISDFGVEDQVDLTELFTVVPTGGSDVDNLDDFARLNPADKTELQVDADGGANDGDAEWVTIAAFDVAQTSVSVIYDDDGSDNSGNVV